MVKKICPDCHHEFECVGRNIRCKVCQEKYRRRYKREQEDSTLTKRQERFWKDKPKSAHAYYTFYQMIKELTCDELRALVSIKRKAITENGADIKMLRTHIKMLCVEYTKKRGMYDESDE